LITDLAQRGLRLGDGTTVAFGTPDFRTTVVKYLKTCKKIGITEGNHEHSRKDSYARVGAFIEKSFAGAQ
jgi:hypothetical protein